MACAAGRRLEALEGQTERLGQALADLRETDGVREEYVKERLSALERMLREVSRGVQLVRDKQVQHRRPCECSLVAPPGQCLCEFLCVKRWSALVRWCEV